MVAENRLLMVIDGRLLMLLLLRGGRKSRRRQKGGIECEARWEIRCGDNLALLLWVVSSGFTSSLSALSKVICGRHYDGVGYTEH